MYIRNKPLEASDEEHVITLDPPLVLSGQVTDAATGEPIPAFELLSGRLWTGRVQPSWPDDEAVAYRDGSYSFRFREPTRGQFILKVSAPGYERLESRPIDMDEGAVTLDLALKPDQERSVPSTAKLRLGKTTEEAKAETKQRRLVVRATAKDTGKSLTGVKIHFQGSLNGTPFEQHLETDAEGMASLEWDADAEFGRLFMTCLKSSFVPIRYLWGDQGKFEVPEEVHLQFEIGKWIGGIVQDPDGRPIEGATVKLKTIVDLPKPAYYWGNVAELTTDAEGRWRWQGMPSDLGVYDLEIEHPDYTGRNQLRSHHIGRLGSDPWALIGSRSDHRRQANRTGFGPSRPSP